MTRRVCILTVFWVSTHVTVFEIREGSEKLVGLSTRAPLYELHLPLDLRAQPRDSETV